MVLADLIFSDGGLMATTRPKCVRMNRHGVRGAGAASVKQRYGLSGARDVGASATGLCSQLHVELGKVTTSHPSEF